MTTIDNNILLYLWGNGALVSEECMLIDLKVMGLIFRELDGWYLCNGVNLFSGISDYLFFGDGMIYGICLRDG